MIIMYSEPIGDYVHLVHEAAEGRYELTGYELHVIEAALQQLSDMIHQDSVGGDYSPLTFEECLREEFLLNTQNYPVEYHNLFNQKFAWTRKRFEEQWPITNKNKF